MEMKVPSHQLPLQRAIRSAIESAVVLQQMRHKQVSDVHSAMLPNKLTSDGMQSDESLEDQPPSGKKRKSTYYQRKEEMAHLQEEMELLEEELQKLEREHTERVAFINMIEESDGLRQCVKQCGVAMAAAQSLVGCYGPLNLQSPAGGYIHLPKDPEGRQRTLGALRMEKIRNATVFMLARSQFLDISKTSRQMDVFESVTGDYTAVHWEVTPLEEAPSVRRAFKELMYYTDTEEMSITEKLGVMTICESGSNQAGGARHSRMLSQYDNGITVETNVAAFAHYFKRSNLLDRPHALYVIDTVDKDELFPYLTQTRIRKDVSAIVMITECPNGSKHTDGRPIVTMMRWAFVKLHKGEFTDSRHLDFVARDGVTSWCDTMLCCVRERLSVS